MADPFADDLELARDALRGSRAARRVFVERMRCVPRFLAVKNRRLGRPFSSEDLEDLVQETLVTIWRRLDSYAGLASIQTWAYRFCYHVMSSRMRSLDRRPTSVPLAEPGGDPVGEPDLRDYEHVYQALEKIDARDALVVRDRHFEHRTFEEIAVRTGIPRSSVKARYYRGLGRLREILDPLRKEAGL